MKYLLGFLATIALVVAVFILVLRGFSSGPKKPLVQLADYSNTSISVEYVLNGRINADLTHRGYRIVVDRSEARLEVFQGYEDNVIAQQSYTNNASAYYSFLRALDFAHYTRGNPNPKLANEAGVCATGSRYVFKVTGGGQKVDQRFWSSSCGGGTFGGNTSQVRQLFQQQIPDFSKLTSNVTF